MGRRTGTESALALVVCFLKARVWKQSDLARAVDLTVPALRRRLSELQDAGVSLERQDEPPHVYWSVPTTWMPHTVSLAPEEVTELARLLARLPNSAVKARVLAKIFESYVGKGVNKGPRAVVPPMHALEEERWLGVVEDAATDGQSLSFRYLSASRGAMETREASPHKVLPGPPARFMATCHRSGRLKWFRVDRVSSAQLAGHDTARRVDDVVLAEALRTSVNGFRDAEAAIEIRFFVREPESLWVMGNLPQPFVAKKVDGGISVVGEAAAVLQIARFVVGLGGAATSETPALRAAVRELARGALDT